MGGQWRHRWGDCPGTEEQQPTTASPMLVLVLGRLAEPDLRRWLARHPQRARSTAHFFTIALISSSSARISSSLSRSMVTLFVVPPAPRALVGATCATFTAADVSPIAWFTRSEM